MRARLRPLWMWMVIGFLLVPVSCGPTPSGTKAPSGPGGTPLPPSPAFTATPTLTPTPVPDPISELRFPWNPKDLGWQAYRLHLQVQLATGEENDRPLTLHEVRYTAVGSPDVLDPTRYWMPEEYLGDDFLYMFGVHTVARKTRPWAYHQNQGQGMWMDGLVSTPWQPLSEDQAFALLHRYLLREVALWSPSLFFWFPQEAGTEVQGLQTTRYRLDIADEEALQKVFALTWLLQPKAKGLRYGQVQWQKLIQGEALLAQDNLLLELNLQLEGRFTTHEGEQHPVRLHIQYSVEPLTPTSDEPLAPDPIPLTGRSILPPPQAPDFITLDLREYFSYMGSPRSGLIWLFSIGSTSEAKMREIFDLYQSVLREMGYTLQEQEPVPDINMLSLIRFSDAQDNTGYMSLFPNAIQFAQAPGTGSIFLEDVNYLGQATLPVILCGYLGGQPLPSRACLLADGTVCPPDAVLAGTCPETAAQGLPLFIPPESLTCFNAYGALDANEQGEWLCRFGAEAAFCEVRAFARGACPRGGDLVEDLKPGEGEYTIVVEGHLKPGEVRFFRLPHMVEDFAPVEEKESVFQEVIPREIMALGIHLKADAEDVLYTVFSAEDKEPRVQGQANAPMFWDWNASHAILEIRAGERETDFTLTVVAAPWLGQGNVRYVVEGTLDSSGTRYFIRPKPLSTLNVQVRGAGVYVSIVEMSHEPVPTKTKVLVPPTRRSTSVRLGYEPDEVLIIVHGPPNAPFVLITQQVAFKSYP